MTTPLARPDPFAEIRMTSLNPVGAPNYWSSRPVVRMDVVVGAYDDISSCEVPGFSEALVRAMPGLADHRCSIGEPGGFLLRLEQGTYAPHVAEHVALELQEMAGHDVGYGRTRGGDVHGEYTLVIEHRHPGVGLRAAAMALDVVQRALAGTLDTVDHLVRELEAIAATPHAESRPPRVLCGITGGARRSAARAALAARHGVDSALLIEVSPAYLLQQGLPYERSEMALVVDEVVDDVPPRYREEDRAVRLLSVMFDGMPRDGIAIVPAKAWELQDAARDLDCRVAVFSDADNITRRDRKVARAAAWPRDGRIVVEHHGRLHDAGALDPDVDVAAQVSAALAAHTLAERGTRDGGAASRASTVAAEIAHAEATARAHHPEAAGA
jgi:cyanophycin synthetase